MNKRYQVFVSSTFVDLKDERQKVLQTLMEMDCIPAGMELFPAADEEQWEFIKKVIDDCDYYLLIIGGRYGSIADDGISYTEKEFDYAVSKNIKVIALLHNEPDSLPREKTKLDPNNYDKLIQFKNKVRNGRLVRFWESSSQLPGEVALSLNKTIKMYPAIGWVRANASASPELLLELNDLRKQNEELKNLASTSNLSSPAICVSDLADFDSKVTLNGTFALNKMSMYLDTEHLSWTAEITWSDLYALVSPFISDKPRESKVSEFIAEHISSVDKNRSGLSDLVLNQQDLFTIRIQLLALGLIDVDTSIPDKIMWSLTEQGEFKMIQSRIIKKIKQIGFYKNKYYIAGDSIGWFHGDKKPPVVRVVFSLSQNEPEIFNSQPHSPQRQRPRRHHTLAAGGLESRGKAQQVVVVIGATGACQHQTKIVQPWLINGVFTDGYDAGQMYRL